MSDQMHVWIYIKKGRKIQSFENYVICHNVTIS